MSAGVFAAAMMGSTSPVLVQTLFDSILHDSTITLANGGQDIVGNINNSGIGLSASAKNSGKFYAEFELVAIATSTNAAFAAGVQKTVAGLNTYLGSNITAFATWVDGSGSTERSTYNNSVRTNVITGQTAGSIGMRCRVAINIGIGVWLSRWGESGWIGGGDPVTGTSPTYVLDSGTYRLAANPRGQNGQLRLVLPDEWSNEPPVGYDMWTAENSEYSVIDLPFSGSNGSTVFPDNTGRVWSRFGNAQISTAQAPPGHSASLLLDGSGDYLTTPSEIPIQIVGDFKMEAWIRPALITKNNTIASKRPSSSASEFTWFVDNGTLGFITWNAGTVVVNLVASTSVEVNEWHKVAIERIGHLWKLLINDVVVASDTTASNPSPNNELFYIGRDRTNTGRDFNGYISNFQFIRYSA